MIKDLEHQIVELKEEVRRGAERFSVLRQELAQRERALKRYLGADQLSAIRGNKVKKWSIASVKKALLVKTRGGKQLLDYVRKSIIPLPCVNSINSRLTNLKIEPGILQININALKEETKQFTEKQKHFVFIYDEKAIIPGVQYDQQRGKKIGLTTLPISNEQAVNAMVVLAAGVHIRLKRAVGLQFMGKKVNAILLHQFLVDLIKKFEDDTSCFVDALVFDLGPHNIAVLNAFGLTLAVGKNENSVEHPNDPNRRLLMFPDPVHGAKCLASAIRRGDVIIPDEFVSKYNLKSKIAKISEIKSLLNRQQKMCYKPGSGLTPSILKPDHFETMNPNTAHQLMSSDVSTAIDFMYMEKGESKKSPMAFVLENFDRWTRIMTNTTYLDCDLSKFDDDILFLRDFMQLIDKIKFKNRIRHQTGAIWSTQSLIELVKRYFAEGTDEVKTSRLTQNAIENIFSQTDSFALKPSAKHFMESLRAVTICQTMLKPVRGSSYTWDEMEEKGICFLEMVAKAEIKYDDPDEINFSENFEVPDVTSEEMFSDNLEYCSFYSESSSLVKNVLNDSDCGECRELLLQNVTVHHLGSQLKRLREDPDKMLSPLAENFLLKAEYVFRQLLTDDSSSIDKTNFMAIVESQLSSCFHCKVVAKKISEIFFRFRVKKMCRREIHTANKFASKSLKC